MKAIIDLAPRGSAFTTAAAQLRVTEYGASTDFRLHFESARSLFSALTPARIELLDTLRKAGPCSVYALAGAAQRNYSNVHGDVAALEELGLVARTEQGTVYVPFESVEIHLALADAA
ncbi:MarR family transcriptional regulator [Pseudoxanthomonas koreensis]|uniref:HVO_A0114 family putative DNA-binding protein n=1 Tax=Pseudoxanthomonas koreensis TaxID=266061 RepID=UPI0013915DF6|nr:MarR family transcriptional regulator [Pseudoxanthomonas koreensis]KAF1695313.1 transcriptional regulator [Pseudoxanthomonas koreensis]